MGGGGSKGDGRRNSKQSVRGRRQGINAGSVDPDAAQNFVKTVIPKSDAVVANLTATLKGNVLFHHLDTNEFQDLVDCMFEVKVAAGKNIMAQGEEGDNFYVMSNGSADVIVDGKKVFEYTDGKGSFGELALIYGTPRAATIKANDDMILYAMDRNTYRCLLMGSVMKKRKLYDEVLVKVKVLTSLENYERSQVADMLEGVDFAGGENIITEGEEGHDFYIILTGKVKVTIKGDEVNQLGVADYFGEIALIKNEPRAATIVADGPTSVAKLDRDRFERVLGPVIDILKRNMDNYQSFQK